MIESHHFANQRRFLDELRGFAARAILFARSAGCEGTTRTDRGA
jgi:hypothetical protein